VIYINIPQITDISTVIKTYYLFPEIGNKEIKLIFGNKSSATVSKLKKLAKKSMYENNVLTHGLYKVNTESAYRAWGIDIKDLEKRMKKLHELNL
jgi:hypothetical protein